MPDTSPPRPALLTAANALTFSRLVLLPLVIAGVTTRHGFLAAGAMLAMWITDLLDGRLARRMGQASPFGKVLDSAVDFVLIYSLFITFYAAGRLATWQFAFLYLSMLAIFSLQLAQLATGGELAATALGKVTGSLQYLYLLFLVAREVLPASRAVSIINLVLFLPLAAAIVLTSVECALLVRRAVSPAAGAADD